MQLETFIADSATDAVSQIRTKLGPEAVVVNVRQLPGRLWKKPRIEILAHAPEPPRSAEPQQTVTPVDPEVGILPFGQQKMNQDGLAGRGWRAGAYLRDLGLLPLYAEAVVDELCASHGLVPPSSFRQELQLARNTLLRLWPTRRAMGATGPHILVGAPGVGKTTALCKWLTQSVLLDGRGARVWRLDGQTANTAEFLSVHGEILGVRVDRSWTDEPLVDEIPFIDLPGTTAPAELVESLRQWPQAQVHLVLHGAYETPLLLAQVRAFSVLPIHDLIVTHLDEERRWGKLWNLALGTSYPLRFLGAGQNIPGEFHEATAEHLLERNFPMKSNDGQPWQSYC